MEPNYLLLARHYINLVLLQELPIAFGFSHYRLFCSLQQQNDILEMSLNDPYDQYMTTNCSRLCGIEYWCTVFTCQYV